MTKPQGCNVLVVVSSLGKRGCQQLTVRVVTMDVGGPLGVPRCLSVQCPHWTHLLLLETHMLLLIHASMCVMNLHKYFTTYKCQIYISTNCAFFFLTLQLSLNCSCGKVYVFLSIIYIKNT